jgi:hypothetical protein
MSQALGLIEGAKGDGSDGYGKAPHKKERVCGHAVFRCGMLSFKSVTVPRNDITLPLKL